LKLIASAHQQDFVEPKGDMDTTPIEEAIVESNINIDQMLCCSSEKGLQWILNRCG
jgi:hypothetical protein